jgi:hypothetical protein
MHPKEAVIRRRPEGGGSTPKRIQDVTHKVHHRNRAFDLARKNEGRF